MCVGGGGYMARKLTGMCHPRSEIGGLWKLSDGKNGVFGSWSVVKRGVFGSWSVAKRVS